MKLLKRSDLDARALDVPTADVPIPEWGEDVGVRVRGLTGAERWAFAQAQQEKTPPDPNAHLIVMAAVDEDGNRLYSHIQDVDAVDTLRGDVLQRIADKVVELSGLGDQGREEAGKGSTLTPNSSTPSTSPSDSGEPSQS